MAGHSQFKNIMHRKGAQDRKRSQNFARTAREITVAARFGGGDPDANARLRSAISAARSINMPHNNIQRAIDKGTGKLDPTDTIDEVRYEGYGPHGVAVIVETITNNRNRSAAAVRSAFAKHGGNLGAAGSVIFQFRHCALATVAIALSEEEMMEAAINIEADEFEPGQEADSTLFIANAKQLSTLTENIGIHLNQPASVVLGWRPVTTIPVLGSAAASVLRLLNALDDLDDVQSVIANFTIDDDEMARVVASL